MSYSVVMVWPLSMFSAIISRLASVQSKIHNSNGLRDEPLV